MSIKPKNILVLTYWSFSDALIQTYTLPYLKLIRKIIPADSSLHLFTLEKEGGPPPPSELPSKIKVLSEKYYPFGLIAIWNWFANLVRLLVYIRKNKITILHCWCTPAGGLGYILSLLSGAELILDSYEPHAEAMVENGTWKKKGLAYRILWYLEKKQTQRASNVIATTPGMKEYARINYKTDIQNFYVKSACVDLDEFTLTKKKNPLLVKELGLENKIVAVYAGKFGGIYLKEEVFQFFYTAWLFWGERLKILLLTSHSIGEIAKLAEQAGLPPDLFVIKYIEHRQIASYIGLGDFALTPVKAVPTKRYCSPIKDGEYWAMGLPILITPNISVDSQLIAANHIGYVWQSNTADEYHKSVLFIDNLLLNQNKEAEMTIRRIAEQYRNFSISETVYKAIYTRY